MTDCGEPGSATLDVVRFVAPTSWHLGVERQ